MPVEHSSTLMFYEICIRMAELCTALSIGNGAYYTDLADQIKAAFIGTFYNPQEHSFGYWGTDGCALMIGLTPDSERGAMLSSLRARMAHDGYAMPTGIYANKYLVPLLFEEGMGDDALRFLFNREHPSFGTMMDDNATSIWEAPDMTDKADPTKGVASYNHPMHGGFLYFTIAQLCGLQPAAPGYAVIRFAPCFTAAADHTSCEVSFISGKVSVSIDRCNGGHRCQLTVPTGVTCIVGKQGCVTVDGKPYDGAPLGSGAHEIFIA
jgi:alpha-L-rhamnosidase